MGVAVPTVPLQAPTFLSFTVDFTTRGGGGGQGGGAGREWGSGGGHSAFFSLGVRSHRQVHKGQGQVKVREKGFVPGQRNLSENNVNKIYLKDKQKTDST